MTMISAVIHRKTHERLTVELEIGSQWWLRNARGDIEEASRAHFPPEIWRFVGSDVSAESFGFLNNDEALSHGPVSYPC